MCFLPTRDTGWVVILLALASLALAAWRTRSIPRWPRGRSVLPLAVVAIVIVVSFEYPLVLRHTVGLDGGYTITETTGYVSETDGERHQSIRRPEPTWANPAARSVVQALCYYPYVNLD